MDRHRRMARTLCCLVASMTLGATVLDWFQPTQQVNHRQSHQLIALLKNDIQPAQGNTQASQPQASWRTILIYPYRPTANSPMEIFHFLVDEKGTITRTNHWKKQKMTDNRGIIRIAMLTNTDSNEITKSQWTATRELVICLQHTCNISDQQTIWDDTLVPSPPQADLSSFK